MGSVVMDDYPVGVSGCLVYAHNWTLKIEGNTISLQGQKSARVGGGKRGTVKGFSDKSRNALLRLMNTLVFDSVHMVTLTFHENLQDERAARIPLYAFRKAFERAYGENTVIWRIERQKRGACHFHLLVLNFERVDRDLFDEWCKDTWERIVTKGAGDADLHRFGVDVVEAHNFGPSDRGALIAYIAKYVGKDEGQEITGRNWGCWRRERLQAKQLEFEIPGVLAEKALQELCRAGGFSFDNPACVGANLFLGDMGRDATEGGRWEQHKLWIDKLM